MKKKATNLAVVVNQRSREERVKKQRLGIILREYWKGPSRAERARFLYKEWTEAEAEWKITRQEARARVHALRTELESYRDQLEGVSFDIPTGDYEVPHCLGYKRKWHVELIEGFNPLIRGFFRMIDRYAEEHGCHESLDFNSKLFDMKNECSRAGFQVGMLAGVMFSGASKETVDRFERGLIFSLNSNQQIVKD